MRQLTAIAAFCVALALTPAWGQMRGGARGFARSMGRVGFAPRGHIFFHGGFGHGIRFHTGFRRNNFFVRRRRLFPFAGYYPYVGYYPGFYGDYSYPVTANTAPPAGYYEAYDSQSEMADEIARLSDQVDRLRDDVRSQTRAPAPGTEPQTTVEASPTVLVFKDKHRQEVQNYAIVGQTLWVFTEQRATRIALASLDVDATMKINDERGVEFRLPAR